MIPLHSCSSRQPDSPWTHESLMSWRSFYISLVPSLRLSYQSALQLYLHFYSLHQIPSEPSADSLSLFLTYHAHSVCPQTLALYLSATCNQLELAYPQVQALCQTPLPDPNREADSGRYFPGPWLSCQSQVPTKAH